MCLTLKDRDVGDRLFGEIFVYTHQLSSLFDFLTI